MFSTVVDVLSAIREIGTEYIDWSSQDTSSIILYSGIVEDNIAEADSIIQSKLYPIYGADTGTIFRPITPYCTVPFGHTSGSSSNTGTGRLISVQANYVAATPGYTAGYVLEFGAATTYGLLSTLEGAQTTTATSGGAIASDTSSTNGDVTVLAAAWITGTAWVSGDKLYFSYIDCYRILNMISKRLAASFTLNEVTVGQAPSESEIGRMWYNRAMSTLDRLGRPDAPDGMALTTLPSVDITPVQVDYPVDEWGIYDSSRAMTDRTTGYNE